jgi:hypothetical protein
MKKMTLALCLFGATCLAHGSDEAGTIEPPAAAVKLGNALNEAIAGAITAHASDTDPQALADAIKKEMGKIDPKSMGIKAPVTPADVEKLHINLNGIKELFERSEAAFKIEHFREAALGYQSVSLATVVGSEDCAGRARDRLIELEGKAKERLNAARDKENVKVDYAGAAKDLEYLLREFPDTVAGKQGVQEMVALRSRPAAAAFLELEQARTLLQQGKPAAAQQALNAIAENPRYRETIAAIEARRLAQNVASNEGMRKLIEVETAAKSEQSARALLAQARNLLKNNMKDKACAALKEIATLYPDSSAAAEAKSLLEQQQ